MSKKTFWQNLGDVLNLAGGIARDLAEDVASEAKVAWREASRTLEEIRNEFGNQCEFDEYRKSEDTAWQETKFAVWDDDVDCSNEAGASGAEPEVSVSATDGNSEPDLFQASDSKLEEPESVLESDPEELDFREELSSESVIADVGVDVSVPSEEVIVDVSSDSDEDEDKDKDKDKAQSEQPKAKRYRAASYHSMCDGSSNGTPIDIYTYSIQTKISSTIPRRVIDDAVGEVLFEVLDDVPSDGVPLDYLSNRYWYLRRYCDRMGIEYNHDLLPETSADYRTANKCLGGLIHRHYVRRQQEVAQVNVSVKLKVIERPHLVTAEMLQEASK